MPVVDDDDVEVVALGDPGGGRDHELLTLAVELRGRSVHRHAADV
jgi:hypothetical protein